MKIFPPSPQPPPWHPARPPLRPITSHVRKSQIRLQQTILRAGSVYGLERLVEIGLTFPGTVTSPEHAQRKLNSLLNSVRKITAGYIWVIELTQRGCLHFHLLLVVGFDARTGTGVHHIPKQVVHGRAELLKRCNPQLRAFWEELEKAARKRGFGQFHLSPIRKNIEAMACYFSKSFRKNWATGLGKNLKHLRLWGNSRNLKAGSSDFTIYKPGQRNWWKEIVEAFVAVRGYRDIEAAWRYHGLSLGKDVFWWVKEHESEEGAVGPPPLHQIS